MKSYDPSSLTNLHPGPWRSDPESFYWCTECGIVAIPAWIGRNVNQSGECIQHRREKLPAANITPKGYLRLNSQLVHRVIARAWIENPNSKPQVNHIDGNKLNNHASNLEWVTNQENQIHAYEILGHTLRNPNRDTNGRFTKKHHTSECS
jgi:hypothetical protein